MKKYQNFDSSLGRFRNHEHLASTNPNWKNILSSMAQSLQGVKDRYPKEKLPQVIPNFNKFQSEDELQFIWFGHSSILLRFEGITIFFDPVLLRSASPFSFFCKRFQEPVVNIEEIPTPDIIVLSHNHHDHYDEAVVQFYAKKKVQFIVPLKLGDYLSKHGVARKNICELNWGEKQSFHGLDFHCTPALHSSGRGLKDQNLSLWSSWLVKNDKHKVFFSGDSGYANHFKEIGEEFGPIDLVFMENGQYDKRWPHAHMFPEESVAAFDELKGKCFVPIHWGMFALAYHPWFESVNKSFDILKEYSPKYFCPKLGQIVSPLKEESIIPWWRN